MIRESHALIARRRILKHAIAAKSTLDGQPGVNTLQAQPAIAPTQSMLIGTREYRAAENSRLLQKHNRTPIKSQGNQNFSRARPVCLSGSRVANAKKKKKHQAQFREEFHSVLATRPTLPGISWQILFGIKTRSDSTPCLANNQAGFMLSRVDSLDSDG